MFTWTNLLVVVVELEGGENEALDLVPLVTNAVLEEHYLIVGVVVVVDPGVVPCYRWWPDGPQLKTEDPVQRCIVGGIGIKR